MKNWWKTTAATALAAAMLSGCSFGGNNGEGEQTPTTLKVMYYDENSFYQEYGMLFSALYPEIELEVVSTQNLYRGGENGEEVDMEKAKKEFLEKEKPDILMLEMKEYEDMSADGGLIDLGPFITKDKFNTEGLVPGMVDYMKELGGGQLYGLPSGFSSQVLFYNKALFDKYNVTYPTDQMTWNEVIQLARQFPIDGEGEDRVYGLKAGYSGDLNQMSQMIANSEGLNYVNPATKTMTINTPGWINAVKTANDALSSEALYFENQNDMMGGSSSYEDYLMRNPFISNRLAMTIESSWFIREMKEASDYIKEEGKVVSDWDIVTMPVSAQFPDQSTGAYYNNIFAIAKDSPNADAAWKFISYISDEEFARVKSKLTYNNGFSIHTKYIKDEEGRNYAAFYKLKPMKQPFDYTDMQKLPKQFDMMFYQYMNEEFTAIQNGTKTVEEGLELLQVKGEELLAQESMTDEEVQELWQKQMEEDQAKLEEAAGEASADAGEAVDEAVVEEAVTVE
ncbi:ABC transporter substrate-binding protein [Paenibacillus soyae]|uniref:Extracellular solute-binding protein n=1 Tax=Paenibacillus soyae TaxID=2969249 RepID=A0A9X2MTJ7_9BACL|nr:extracellular solute-binding protein [Paenibacillus soyae]MCR2803487.1 extracellular solute-binding protein [Paenibacillus soyae]